jgi:hypothetical protein
MTFSHFKKDWSRLINFDFITVVIWTKLFCEFKTHESFIIFVSCNFYITNHWFFLKSFVKEKMISKKVFFCWAFWDHLKKISTLCILFVCRVKVHKPRQVVSIHSYQQKSSPRKCFLHYIWAFVFGCPFTLIFHWVEVRSFLALDLLLEIP